MSLGIPAIGVTAFDALAFGAANNPTLLVLPGPRDQIYVKGLNGAGPSEVETCTVDGLPDISPSTVVIGPDAELIAEKLGCTYAPPHSATADAIALVAATRLDNAAEPPKPFYIRAADAAPASDPPPVILP